MEHHWEQSGMRLFLERLGHMTQLDFASVERIEWPGADETMATCPKCGQLIPVPPGTGWPVCLTVSR